MSRYVTTLGIVINKKVYKESDLVITLLTPYIGKLTAIAKGAKRIKSSRLGALELGNIIKAQLYEKDNFYWLSQSISITSFLKDQKNLSQLNLLFYFLELINRVIGDNQQIDGVYQTSQRLIEAINQHRSQDYLSQEIELIELLGFGMPPEITDSFKKNHFRQCQQLIQQFLEAITEKPFESNRSFR
jgi:DNA repair protein RecO (recombination protein O)